MPTREEAKEIRRTRILTAARELIRETERTRFSMRALAERLISPGKTSELLRQPLSEVERGLKGPARADHRH